MKLQVYNIKQLALVVAVMLFATSSSLSQATVAGPKSNQPAQITLKIGDPAPAIKYSRWLKGTPVSTLNPNDIYVIEFWATWCGPCNAIMPHLSELAKKYSDKVTFASFDVWETLEGENAMNKKPYNEVLDYVQKFVKAKGDRMSYNVGADTKDGFMAKNWLAASGQIGIPASFIVQNNQIIWCGHPAHLDSVIIKVLNGSYDSQAFGVKYNKKAQRNLERQQKDKELLQPFKDAMEAKRYVLAAKELDTAMTKAPAPMVKALRAAKFSVLLEHVGNQQAFDYYKNDWYPVDSISAAINSASYMATKKGLSKQAYDFGIKNAQAALGSGRILDCSLYTIIARCYNFMGDSANAIKYQQLGVNFVKDALEKKLHLESINKDVLKDYETVLEKYKGVN